ncbi:hypothetical protein HaLaN_02721, partial [Haematococcus lacustris]
MGPGC